MSKARNITLSFTGAILTVAFVNSVNRTFIKDAKMKDVYPFGIGMLLIGASLRLSGNYNVSTTNMLQWAGVYLVAQGVCTNWHAMSRELQTAILGASLLATFYAAQKTEVFQNIGRLGGGL